MGNLPFDREVINFREKPISSDHNYSAQYADRTQRALMKRLLSGRTPGMSGILDTMIPLTSAAFVGDGYKARPRSPAALYVDITPGMGFLDNGTDLPVAIGGVVGVDDVESFKPLTLAQLVSFGPITPPSTGGQGRIDIVEVKIDRRLTDATPREQMNTSGVFVPGVVNKTLTWDHGGDLSIVATPNPSTGGIGYKTGTPAAYDAETVPATTSGYTKIAEVYVKNGDTSIDASRVKDMRQMLFPGGCGFVSANIRETFTASGAVMNASSRNTVAPPGVIFAVHGYTGHATIGVTIGVFAGENLGGANNHLPLVISPCRKSDNTIGIPLVATQPFLTKGQLLVAKAAQYADPIISDPTIVLPGGVASSPGFVGITYFDAFIWFHDMTNAIITLTDGEYIEFSVFVPLGR